jgi:hypothetical protein
MEARRLNTSGSTVLGDHIEQYSTRGMSGMVHTSDMTWQVKLQDRPIYLNQKMTV